MNAAVCRVANSHTAHGEEGPLTEKTLAWTRYRFSRLVRSDMDVQDFNVQPQAGEHLRLVGVLSAEWGEGRQWGWWRRREICTVNARRWNSLIV